MTYTNRPAGDDPDAAGSRICVCLRLTDQGFREFIPAGTPSAWAPRDTCSWPDLSFSTRRLSYSSWPFSGGFTERRAQHRCFAACQSCAHSTRQDCSIERGIQHDAFYNMDRPKTDAFSENHSSRSRRHNPRRLREGRDSILISSSRVTRIP
jgi:hypothetical protein